MVDMEFVAQHLQLIGAASGGPLRQNTAEALDALIEARPELKTRLGRVREAWRLQQNLSQLLKIALDDRASPDDEPAAFRTLLARAGGAKTYAALRSRLEASRKAAHVAFVEIVRP
jgi:glutamate-ammonia-ligase adenylyltransferase